MRLNPDHPANLVETKPSTDAEVLELEADKKRQWLEQFKAEVMDAQEKSGFFDSKRKAS